jgi:hypothetical protein
MSTSSLLARLREAGDFLGKDSWELRIHRRKRSAGKAGRLCCRSLSGAGGATVRSSGIKARVALIPSGNDRAYRFRPAGKTSSPAAGGL